MNKYMIVGERFHKLGKEKMLEKGVYCYDLRDWDFEEGFNIELSVGVNHIGTMLTNFKIEELKKRFDFLEMTDLHKLYKVKRAGTVKELMQVNECPNGGDNTDCGNCAYAPDYKWSEKELDCIKVEVKQDTFIKDHIIIARSPRLWEEK